MDVDDADKQRNIIRLWNELRRLKRNGQATEAIRQRLEAALAERDQRAA